MTAAAPPQTVFDAYWKRLRPFMRTPEEEKGRYAFDFSWQRVLHKACSDYCGNLGAAEGVEPKLLFGRTLFGNDPPEGTEHEPLTQNPLLNATVYNIASPFQFPPGRADDNRRRNCICTALAFFEVTDAMSRKIPKETAKVILHQTRRFLSSRDYREDAAIYFSPSGEAPYPADKENGLIAYRYAGSDEAMDLALSWMTLAYDAFQERLGQIPGNELDYSQAWLTEALAGRRNWTIYVPSLPPKWQDAINRDQIDRHRTFVQTLESRVSEKRGAVVALASGENPLFNQTTLLRAWCQLAAQKLECPHLVYMLGPYRRKLTLNEREWAGIWQFFDWPIGLQPSEARAIGRVPLLLYQQACLEADAVWQVAHHVGAKWLRSNPSQYHRWFLGDVFLPKLLSRFLTPGAERRAPPSDSPMPPLISLNSEGNVDELKEFVQVPHYALSSPEIQALQSIEHDFTEEKISSMKRSNAPSIWQLLKPIRTKCAEAGGVAEPLVILLSSMEYKNDVNSLVDTAVTLRRQCHELLENTETSFVSYLNSRRHGEKMKVELPNPAKPNREPGGSASGVGEPLPFRMTDFRRVVDVLKVNGERHRAETTTGADAEPWDYIQAVITEDRAKNEFLQITWEDNSLGFRTAGGFTDAVLKSCREKESQRGLPRAIMFGFENEAHEIRILLVGDDGKNPIWQTLYPVDGGTEQAHVKPGVRFAIQWIFPRGRQRVTYGKTATISG